MGFFNNFLQYLHWFFASSTCLPPHLPFLRNISTLLNCYVFKNFAPYPFIRYIFTLPVYFISIKGPPSPFIRASTGIRYLRVPTYMHLILYLLFILAQLLKIASFCYERPNGGANFGCARLKLFCTHFLGFAFKF